jgi:hypothetical protein
MALEQRDYDQASALLEQGLTVRRALGDRSAEAASLNSVGVVAW